MTKSHITSVKTFFSALALSTFALTACAPPQAQKVGEYSGRFQLVGIDPPKHYYVDLKNVKTGQMHEHVYISKHCNGWRTDTQPLIGREFDLTVTRYNNGKGEYEEFNADQLRRTFCPS